MMRTRVWVAAAVAVCLVPVVSRGQALTHRDVSVKMALAIVDGALAMCGTQTSIAVVDYAGRVRVLVEGDTASPHNPELARRKAYTARTFRTTSGEWATRTETTNKGQRELDQVIPLQGGVPIMIGDEAIGGVGLSGATGGGMQEEACAKAGIAKVADQLK
jgi:uncharacterized protein GlcG (DUF336 family)